MSVQINFSELDVLGRVTALPDVPEFMWARVREAILGLAPAAEVSGRTITVDWGVVISAAPELAYLREHHGVVFSYDDGARRQLQRFRQETERMRALQGQGTVQLAPAEIMDRLIPVGFTRRELTGAQLRDTARMAALGFGANFSVPGAGKTTVALAVHLLTKAEGTRLLVIAPKNAFVAWDEVLDECLEPVTDRFVRLTGGVDEIRRILLSDTPPQLLIISYDQLRGALRLVTAFLARYPTHVILDESHRIKAGMGSQRGQAVLSLAHLAVRRDILSGTPMPNGVGDLTPQLEFLWPGHRLGEQVETAPRPRDILGPYYVRTTKHELGLGPVYKEYLPVEMTKTQHALYGIIKDELLKVEAGLRHNPSNVDIESARRSVLSLLQVASNPILLVNRLTGGEPIGFAYDNQLLHSLFLQLYEEGDSPKIRRACEIARALASQGERTVIWSTFTGTVERVADLLSDLGATFIHGGVDTGDASDPNTREGRIARFHDDESGCQVLVANPAACSEGISLHRVCNHAIYVDRSFNAAHFLQSVDRIHRLWEHKERPKFVHILESVAAQQLGSVDHSVRRRLVVKLRAMVAVLEDQDLQQLMLDEENAQAPIDFDLTREDIIDVLDELRGVAPAPGEEELF